MVKLFVTYCKTGLYALVCSLGKTILNSLVRSGYWIVRYSSQRQQNVMIMSNYFVTTNFRGGFWVLLIFLCF